MSQQVRSYQMPHLSHLRAAWRQLENQYTSEWALELMPYLKRGVKAFYDIDSKDRAYICSLYLSGQKIESQDDFIAHMDNPGQLLNDLLHCANQPEQFNKLLEEVEQCVCLDCESTLSTIYYEMRAILEDY